jgi:hypothetical protein
MLTALEIENFKGIATRQRVEFAPLTLLFGPNSAGKSTILQALLYLQDALERGTADVGRTEIAGEVVDLGGFARLVHRHESHRAIGLRAEFATPGHLDRFGRDLEEDFPFPSLDDDFDGAWVELRAAVRRDLTPSPAVVEWLLIGVRGHDQPLAILDLVGQLRDGEPLYFRVNLAHPILGAAGLECLDAWRAISVTEPLWHGGIDPVSGEHVLGLDDIHGLDREHGPMPLFAASRTRASAIPPLNEPISLIIGDQNQAEYGDTVRHVRAFLEMVVLGTTSQLAKFLRDTLYIGPLRTIPPRGFLYQRAGRTPSWGDGLAAWDRMLADRGDLVERVNQWLDRLGARCKVVVQELFDHDAEAEDLSEGHIDSTVRRLLLDMGAGALVLPSEVGAGVSQIMPIIVAALETASGLSMFEQPEIHVHPAIQVGLGDLLIEAVTRDGGRRMLLVETHSEHLMLRLQRRIRQTTEHELEEGAPSFAGENLSVVYVERGTEGVCIRRLGLDEQGDFTDRWPKGFFDERFAEVYGS